jgi:phosphate transport system substrate-binding protein
MKRHSRSALLALPLALALVASACGGDETTDGTGGSASGVVNVTGSSTVAPISTRVAELWEQQGDAATVNVDGPGTGDGFMLFCQGEADVTGASRPIKDSEADECREAGVEYIELKVALDGLSVITSRDNDVECLNFVDLYAIAGPESQGLSTWEQAGRVAKDLGSTTAFPTGPLAITAPGEESGTYDAFVELALSDTAGTREEAGEISEDDAETTRPDYQSSGDDNVILQGVAGSATSFGWVGLAFAEEAADQVREIPVAAEVGGECVEPTAETVASGVYPLSRPLFIYVNAASAADKQAVADYVDFYVSDSGLVTAVEEVKYVPLPEDQRQATVARWEARTTGIAGGSE